MSMELSEAERGFVDRMAIKVAEGLSFDDAAKAVKADDERIKMWLYGLRKDDRAELVNGMASIVYQNVRKAG